MTPDRLRAIETLFHAALKQPTEERAAFVEARSGGDVELRREVEALLAREKRAQGFLASPPLWPDSTGGTAPFVGQRLGPYEIVSQIGAGGMGVVYRARDTKLNRQVAIKVLPALLAGDPSRLQRLQREARVLASLNDPKIATIYGLEESQGTYALVMELVEGDDLKQRIARGPVRLDEGLRIAQQIANALEAAHAQGIIHRDLKPANVKVRADGTVKVLDFGLAKAMEPEISTSGSPDESPTITQHDPMTTPGMIIGTAAYMSPEQARGHAVDKRADIWAFGCVLYELLSRRSTFPGPTISDTIASVLERQPDWSLLPPETPAAIRRLLRRCLEKDPKSRLHDIADARLELDDVVGGRREDQSVALPPPRRLASVWLWSAGVIALAAAAVAGWSLRPIPVAREIRLELDTPATGDPTIAISPDGQKVVYVIGSGRKRQLWLRSLDSSTPKALPGTEDATRPFWSPDGKSVGFYANAKIKRLNIDGGSPQVVVKGAAIALGGTWNRDGVILFNGNPGGPVLRTSIQGEAPVEATKLGASHRGHFAPEFFPDGRHFLFFVNGTSEVQGVYLGDLGGTTPKRLFEAAGSARVSGGDVLFIRDDKLYAQAVDLGRGEMRGDPIVVVDHINPRSFVSASVAGPIVYRTPPGDFGRRQFTWFDRSGRELDKLVYSDTAALGSALSHDGRRIATYRFQNGNMDIWAYDLDRRLWDRITSHRGDEIYPLWSRDDRTVIFAAARTSPTTDLYRKLVSAPLDSAEVLLASPEGKFPMDLSPDDKTLLYTLPDAQTGVDIWALPLEGDRTPVPVVKTEFDETMPQFSPNGRWIAFQSDKTGRNEIYLRAFPGPGKDVQVSVDGGGQTRWNPNGDELFYVAADDRLMSVRIQVSADKKSLEPGVPVGLFATNVGSTATQQYRQHYMVAKNGQTFIMETVADEGSASPVSVILNWRAKR